MYSLESHKSVLIPYWYKSILINQIALFEGYNGSYIPCEAGAHASKPANQIHTHRVSHVAVQQGDLLGSKIQLRSSFMDLFVDAPDLYDLEEFHLDKKQKARRFNSPVSKDKIDALVDSRIPANTIRTTSWCIGSWNTWCDARGLSPFHSTTKTEQASLSTQCIYSAVFMLFRCISFPVLKGA